MSEIDASVIKIQMCKSLTFSVQALDSSDHLPTFMRHLDKISVRLFVNSNTERCTSDLESLELHIRKSGVWCIIYLRDYECMSGLVAQAVTEARDKVSAMFCLGHMRECVTSV